MFKQHRVYYLQFLYQNLVATPRLSKVTVFLKKTLYKYVLYSNKSGANVIYNKEQAVKIIKINLPEILINM